jgi:hypothetical protein
MNRYHLKYWVTVGSASVVSGLIIAMTSACSQTSSMTQPLSNSPSTSMNTTLDPKIQQAMIDSINDEYQARAFYNAVIKKFGNVRPFTNIVQAENRHVQYWITLFQQYGLPIPKDTFADRVTAPNTLREACQMGVAAEIANVKMYDNFLGFVKQSDLRNLFNQLRNVSQNKHKSAFERCLQR